MAITIPTINYNKSKLPKYMKSFGIDDLNSATEKKLHQVFLAVCDDFFVQQITIYGFSAISENLLYRALEIGKADLSGAIEAATELYYYQRHEQDDQKFFSFLKEVMEFYLQRKNKKTQQV